MPTIMLRPMTTASAPLVSMPEASSSLMQPAGVQGTKPRGILEHEFGDVFRVEAIDILARIDGADDGFLVDVLGRRDWTRMPWMAGSALRSRTTWSSSSWVVSAGSSILRE